MFKIKYSFSDSFLKKDIDYKIEDEMSLHYDLFLGGIILSSNDSEIDLDWKWIPLLDFAYHLLDIALEISKNLNCHEKFEFTESNGLLLFDRIEKKVKISTSYSDEKIDIDIEEFKLEVKRFYKKLITDIIRKYPEVQENRFFIEYINLRVSP